MLDTRIVEAVRVVVREGVALLTEMVIVTEWDSDPFVPVIVNVKVPLAEDGQDMLDIPSPDMMVGESVQESPVDGDAVAVRVTGPTNPFRPVTVRVEFAMPPTTTLAVIGLAATVKSRTM